MLRIVTLESLEHLISARKLFQEYSETRAGDPALTGFAAEIAGLPGKYAGPKGCLLLAYCEDEAVGCVALHEWKAEVAEMKRLYVQPSHRGFGIGKTLVKRIIEEANAIGYSHLRLDTIPGMDRAQALYRDQGFRQITPYRHNPNAGTLFFELSLNR